jgi:endonuclease III
VMLRAKPWRKVRYMHEFQILIAAALSSNCPNHNQAKNAAPLKRKALH